MVVSLDKKWKELLFSAAGFGPNFLMILMGAFFTDANFPVGLPKGSFQASSAVSALGVTSLILPALFPILWALAKAFDGVVDIPMAALTDSLSTKWGRRRPTILICLPFMLLSYAMCWMPVGSATFNTIWIFVWALIFFTTYTLSMISYYGSLSSICTGENQRMKISGYKAFFDTISYCFTYALVPLVLDLTKTHIDTFALICVPLILTMAIPLFLIKEGKKWGYPENKGLKEEKVSITRSFKLTFGNKIFGRWLWVNNCSYFGLQMFLVGMNIMILGGMDFGGFEMAILNTCAFAPVPIMLYLMNKLIKSKGLRFVLCSTNLIFAISIIFLGLGNTYFCGDNTTLKFALGITGSVLSSWSIGGFFMIPYIIPSQIANVEEKVLGINHSAMYFAAQAFTTSIVGAISGSLIYEYIKMFFISKSGSIVRADNAEEAIAKLGVDKVFNLGALLIPLFVSIFCFIAFMVARKLPKRFSTEEIASSFEKMGADTKNIVIDDAKEDEDKGKDSVFVNLFLWLLSMGLFGFIWQAFVIKKAESTIGKKDSFLQWILCSIIPFYGAFYLMRTAKALNFKRVPLYLISGIIFPILPFNIIGLSLLTKDAEI